MTCAQGQCVAACPDGMVYVPAGEFIRGTTAWNQPDEQPVRNIYLSAFCMDATEVTTSAYTSCFSSGF
jgi:formylglycine-generating enzyme required for sulfatase activity